MPTKAPGRINRAALRKMERDFAAAAAAGHHCDHLIPVRQTKTQVGWSCTCTCGWTSNSRKRKLAAASLGYLHVLDAANGVVPPAENWIGEMPAEIDGVSVREIVGAAAQD